MPKINQEEYEVFKSKSPQWNWIARNEDNRLFVYIGEPIKDNLEWDVSGFGRHWLFEMDNLFQFIQWEDEEPYDIAELIEEYEEYEFYDYVGWEYYESEETEVKDKMWLKDSITKEMQDLFSTTNPNYFDFENTNKKIRGFVNQLDEPEVLSQEWIDENSTLGQFITNKVINFDKFVKADKLKNLLVPKQEEVDRAYKDGYEKGKEHATEKQSEETETVASVFVDFLIASAKLKLALSMEVEELEE